MTQHYGSCWSYNLGSDAEPSGTDLADDQRVGPHVYKVVLAGLNLAGDGSDFSRVSRISRFVKW